ncbi:Bro-N domain-containing protein [Kitasatospora sp. NBC_01287]|uniref:BRO-N domain-containing protein n=1 Tax=Kitasatospora sp. NBC_01287 TaxID=2903573 RepID=UPI00225428E6|nr:Bro-N domain-containing protein [Kitasatospora sp. NBC_01287]MCX4747603.1 Bro-N domain-containing protein [Kitasatospora sp. NBC_01287]
MIDGEPWFATADLCAVLHRGSPTWASRMVGREDTRTIDMRSVCLSSTQAYDRTPGQNASVRGNPYLNVINEAGLYTLILRSRKPNAAPFQEWVTRELLPSVRRGDTDVPRQRQRMAETLAEAIGQQVRIVAEIERDDLPGVRVHSDGTLHCAHGEMTGRLPAPEEDSGPPFGPYFECPEPDRVGIRGSRLVTPGCGKVRLVELARWMSAAPRADPAGPEPDASTDLMTVRIDRAEIQGSPGQVAELIRLLAA